MKIRNAATAFAALLLVPAAWAQTGTTSTPARSADAPAPTAGKVAVLNFQAAIAGTGEGKQALAELQTQFAPRNTELENLNKQIEDLRTRLRNGASTLSDDEKARLARQGDQLTRTLQRKQQDVQDDANEAQRDVVDRLGRKMVDILDRYARDNDFAVVIDDSQSPTVLYAAPQVEITQDIIRLYDQTYPVKASVTNPARSTPPRPTTPAPKPTTPQKP